MALLGLARQMVLFYRCQIQLSHITVLKNPWGLSTVAPAFKGIHCLAFQRAYCWALCKCQGRVALRKATQSAGQQPGTRAAAACANWAPRVSFFLSAVIMSTQRNLLGLVPSPVERDGCLHLWVWDAVEGEPGASASSALSFGVP